MAPWVRPPLRVADPRSGGKVQMRPVSHHRLISR